MNFIYKSFLQNLFSRIPKGELINYAFQRYVTRSLPVSHMEFLEKVRMAGLHHASFINHHGLVANSKRYYEFGAGWDIITPITMALLDFEVTCIDIRKLIKDELIRDTIEKFKAQYADLEAPVNMPPQMGNKKPMEYIAEELNITYKAPLDARRTCLPSDYFDFASSTVTFEHIPEIDIGPILTETYRILKKGGVLSLIIDYKDHWSYFDPTVSIYNFLKFSEVGWKRHNPVLHFQNRLRHKDYLSIIARSPFTLVEETLEKATKTEYNALRHIKLDNRFKEYNLDELSIKGSHLVLRK